MDITDNLKKFGLPPELAKDVADCFKIEQVKKGKLFSMKGKVCSKIGLLVTRILYAYYEKEDDSTELISRFFTTRLNNVVTSFESFSTQARANESIKAIEKSQLLVISHGDLSELYEKIPEMNKIGRQLAEQSYVQALQRMHSLQALGNDKRIAQLFIIQPELFTEVPKTLLASYLGMHRNAISEYFKKCRKTCTREK